MSIALSLSCSLPSSCSSLSTRASCSTWTKHIESPQERVHLPRGRQHHHHHHHHHRQYHHDHHHQVKSSKVDRLHLPRRRQKTLDRTSSPAGHTLLLGRMIIIVRSFQLSDIRYFSNIRQFSNIDNSQKSEETNVHLVQFLSDQVDAARPVPTCLGGWQLIVS